MTASSQRKSRPGRPRAESVELDDTDRAILAELTRDGRMTNALLAARVTMSESTTAARVRRLRENGVIRAVTARVDYRALGYPIQAIIKVRMGDHTRAHVYDLFERLTTMEGALSVMHVAGEDDFHVHVAATSPEDLRDLVLEHITTHPAVRQTETQLAFEVRDGAGVTARR